MVKSLSDNSFIIYENMAGERTLCLKVTIDLLIQQIDKKRNNKKALN